MVTHDLDSLEAICDRIAVLVDERIKVGTMAELLQDDHPWIREYFHGPRARADGATPGLETMETRASHIAVGAFVLVLMVGLRRFRDLDRASSGQESYARYDILFAAT